MGKNVSHTFSSEANKLCSPSIVPGEETLGNRGKLGCRRSVRASSISITLQRVAGDINYNEDDNAVNEKSCISINQPSLPSNKCLPLFVTNFKWTPL